MQAAIERFLREDLGRGDRTSQLVLRGETALGKIIAKERGILAGIPEACAVFRLLGATPRALRKDGAELLPGLPVLEVRGPARALLAGERLALNFLMRMSGIATATRALLRRARAINPSVEIAATRKTTPGFRAFEKRAVSVGGGVPHRMRLDSAILIKDNHIRIAGSLEEAIRRAQSRRARKEPIEVEVERTGEAERAARLGVEWLLVDNMTPREARRAAEAARAVHPQVRIEVSGGLSERTIGKYVAFADRLSVGALTHSVKSLDFSMELAPLRGLRS